MRYNSGHQLLRFILPLWVTVLAATVISATTSAQRRPSNLSAKDGQHDFDFEIGTWRDHISRLEKPLTGSQTWVQYDGTLDVRKVWGGRANLAELEVYGPAGHIEGLSLRMYNPQSKQWSIHWANSTDGTLDVPAIGSFENGRGEFYNQEQYQGRAIFVRGVFSSITRTSCYFEQSFSIDGGKTWEVNFIETLTRLSGKEDAASSGT